VEYSSFETFLSSLAEGYRRGAFYNHPDGYIGIDDEVYDRIAASKNPDVEWWSH
jgi:hypothetical protein